MSHRLSLLLNLRYAQHRQQGRQRSLVVTTGSTIQRQLKLSVSVGLESEGIEVKQHIALIISDIEMPEMDGYSLTSAVQKDPDLETIKILSHSSMSAEFNESLVEKVAANKFIAKFDPDELPSTVQDLVNEWRYQ